MKRVLVDKNNNIVYEGVHAKEILRILNADIYSISEEDEIKYSEFRNFLDNNGNCIYEDLRYEVHFNLKFRGFDDWARPIFKDIDSNLYFGSVHHLQNNNVDVVKYLSDNPNELEYFGDKFNCEPHGGTQSFFKFNIIQ